MVRIPALPTLAALLVGACATPDAGLYPSLERRAIERRASVPPAPPVVAVPEPVSATLSAALAALEADAVRGEAAFRAALPAARAARAGGEATGSEAWAQANVALSRLDAARAPTLLALAELDRLGLDSEGAALEAVAALQARVAALVAGQRAVLDEL